MIVKLGGYYVELLPNAYMVTCGVDGSNSPGSDARKGKSKLSQFSESNKDVQTVDGKDWLYRGWERDVGLLIKPGMWEVFFKQN